MMLPITNKLLDGLPKKSLDRIFENSETVQLTFGEVLCEADKQIQFVYFPLYGIISLVTVLGDDDSLEVGLIGNEGILGATIVLGLNVAPTQAIVQGAGTALRMTVAQLQAALDSCPQLLKRIYLYIFTLILQLNRLNACTHFHEIEPRLARWLLMTQDRAHSDNFHLTQEFLALMLGVRRSGVTVAAGSLQAQKLIDYSRGDIKVLNRKGLELISCSCYKKLLKDYKTYCC